MPSGVTTRAHTRSGGATTMLCRSMIIAPTLAAGLPAPAVQQRRNLAQQEFVEVTHLNESVARQALARRRRNADLGGVDVVTITYTVVTTSLSGLLQPGLLPALIPIGLLSGLSAMVCLLLVVSVADNKIQGLAMVRALGMLTAGLRCLPWFIDSAWNLTFAVLPPYWAAKAFWVASDHGTWWPYVAGGMAYNLAIALVLLRRSAAKITRLQG